MTSSFVTRTVALWPNLHEHERKQIVSEARRHINLRITGWEVDKAVLDALGIDWRLGSDVDLKATVPATKQKDAA